MPTEQQICATPTNILLVDDRAENLLSLEVILDELKQNLVKVQCGEDALRALLTTDFALVILDVQMHGLDGYETAKRIRAQPRSRHTPIVFVTAYDTDVFPIIEAYKLGAVDYLIKPLVPEILRAKVACFVDLFQQKERARLMEREQQARIEAERQRDLRDQLLAMMAHELRNPLATVLTSLYVIREAGVDIPDVKRSVDLAQRQALHLSRLINELLDVSRIARGQIKLKRERLDLARMVRETAEDMRGIIESRTLLLDLHVPETPVWVDGDATRLAQALSNLLDNAAKFSDAGGRIGVSVTRESDKATISVQDTGIGLDNDTLRRIWDVFAQAEQGLARSRGGMGLGLAIVKGLISLHGGTVEAFSNGPGFGATFLFKLNVQPEPAALSSKPQKITTIVRPLRILVIEDNRDAADSLRMMLELLGHDARVAYTGPEGVKIAREWVPEFVLCDIGLPGLDGYGVAKQLRADATTAGVRLVALTGYGNETDRRQAQQAGFNHHLTKPAAPEALLELLVPA